MKIDLGEEFGGLNELFEGIEVPRKVKRVRSPESDEERKARETREANRLVHSKLDNDDLDLDEIWRIANDKREWIEDSIVALIHEQECLGCGALHSWSQGWFTGKHHARDKTATVLTAGRPQGDYPRKVQRVRCSPVVVCSDCAESQALIENIAGVVNDPS